MDELVKRLSTGSHRIVASRARDSPELLQQSIERGLVLLSFTDTRGGTELGVDVDRASSDLSAADFVSGRGHIRLVGNLSLNGVALRCVAVIDLASLSGTGHLEALPA